MGFLDLYIKNVKQLHNLTNDLTKKVKLLNILTNIVKLRRILSMFDSLKQRQQTRSKHLQEHSIFCSEIERSLNNFTIL